MGEKNEVRLAFVESNFADIIWENEPLSSSELAKRSEALLNWKKTTSYTVLKRLCDKGIFQNVKGVVTSLISKQELFAMQSEHFVEDTFDGSLPAFVAAFTTRKRLSAEEIADLRRIIDEHEEA